MRVGGEPVAAIIALDYAGRFWILKTGFDESWSFCSPGVLLMHEVIRQAFALGRSAFEFLGEDEEWIRVWTANAHDYTTHFVYPFTASGVFSLGKEALHYALRRIGPGKEREPA